MTVETHRRFEVRDDRSIGEVLSDLSTEASTLISRERRLIELQAERKLDHATSAAIQLGVAGGVAFVALQVAALALVALLFLWMPLWAAAGLVAALLGGAALVLSKRGADHAKEIPPSTSGDGRHDGHGGVAS